MNAALELPVFRRYLLMRVVVVLAWQVQSVAVGWQVYDRSGEVMDLGWVGLAIFLPFLLTAPVAGDLADRYNRGRIAIVGLSALAILSALLVAASSPDAPRYALFLVLVGVGSMRSLLAAASGAVLPLLVPRGVLVRAVTLNSGVFQLCTLLGPAMAGGLVAGLGVPATHMIATAGYALGALMYTTIPIPDPAEAAKEPMLRRVAGGLSYVRRTPVLLGALSLDVVAVFFGGAVALLPVFARDLLVIGPWGLGLLRSATGLGAVGAAAWMAWRPLGAKVGRTLFVSVTVFGLATVLLGVAPDLPTALVALVVIGASDMVSVVVRQNLIQLRTPEEVRGRVVAVNQVFVGASNELGELESGVAATALGPRAAVVVGGLIVVLVTTTWTRLFPSLRALDRLDDQPADVIEKDRPS